MAKASFLLAVLCGLANLSRSLADPSIYGAAAAAKYPAPATYLAPATYPAPAAYPAPAKYETPAPTTTAKYEAPAAKYEAEKPKYEEKKEEYSMKTEYKKEEYPTKPTEYKKEEYPMKMEYKKEDYPMKPEYKKEAYPMKQEYKKEEYPAPMKMQYGGKKYRRSIDDDMEEAKDDVTMDSEKMEDPLKLTSKVVQTVRDAVIQELMSMMDDDLDVDGSRNLGVADDGEEEDEQTNEDDETFISPEMDSTMGDDIDTQADPMMMRSLRFLIRKRIQSRMCRPCYKCAGRSRPWMIRPMSMKRRRLVYRPTARPIMIRFPPRMRCFWKRVCC